MKQEISALNQAKLSINKIVFKKSFYQGKINMKKLILVLLIFCLLLCACNEKSASFQIFTIGDTYESHDAAVTVNDASVLESLLIDGQEVLPEGDGSFLVVDVSIRAISHVYLKPHLFNAYGLANEQLTRELNGGVAYISNYVLVPSVTATFKVVFTLTEGDLQAEMYSVEIYGVFFVLDSAMCLAE